MKRTSSRRSDVKDEQADEKTEYPAYGGQKRQVILTMARSTPDDKEEKEVVDSVFVAYDENGNIKASSVSDHLKKVGYPVTDSMISYYSSTKQVYIYLGNYPLAGKSILSSDVEEEIKIKVRPKAKSIFGDFLLGNNNASISKGSRRTKERKIGDVIKKVAEWRKLYNGIEEGGELIKKSLEEAAKEVSISKKSLDDYLLQLRNGRKYGFNFNEHKDDKIGILRAFNRKHRSVAGGK